MPRKFESKKKASDEEEEEEDKGKFQIKRNYEILSR